MIGAVVLVAAAVILIPEMLTGTKTPPKAGESVALTAENAQDDASKLKTYTIDLSKDVTPSPPTESQPLPSLSESAAPRIAPEQSAAMSAPPPEESTQTVATTPVRPSEPEKRTEPPREAERPATAVASAAQPQPESKKGNSASASGWSVQVGSFGVRATSDRVAADLKKEGFSAFVVAFQSGNQTMYRVRVGPERDRAAAEGLLRKLKLHHPGATLVPPA